MVLQRSLFRRIQGTIDIEMDSLNKNCQGKSPYCDTDNKPLSAWTAYVVLPGHGAETRRAISPPDKSYNI